MANFCKGCGVKLPLLQHVIGGNLCAACKEKRQALHQEAVARYPALLKDVWSGRVTEADGTVALERLRAGLAPAEQASINGEIFRSFAGEVLADDILTEDEEKRLTAVGAKLLGITQPKLQNEFRDVLFRLFVARINDGRLPTIETNRIILRAGEQAHMEMAARLLKHVAIREYQGGYSGFSFRIAKGVTYHTGATRGRRVEVGTETKEDDTGVLVVTSHRAVFLGSKKSLEMPYAKLLSLEVFDDGVRFHLSNRKTSPLFGLEDGHVVVAALNAAMQRL